MGWLALALLVLAGALVARAALFAAQLGVQLRQLRKLPSPRLGILGIDSWRDKVSGAGAAWRTARCCFGAACWLLAVPSAAGAAVRTQDHSAPVTHPQCHSVSPPTTTA